MTGAAFGGEAIGHLPDGRVVFVPRGLPGETARVRLYEERRDFARADLVEVQRPAPGRVEPPCPHYQAGCGGGTIAIKLGLPSAENMVSCASPIGPRTV